MNKKLAIALTLFAGCGTGLSGVNAAPSDNEIMNGLQSQSLNVESRMLSSIRREFSSAHSDYCANQGRGNSKVDFSAVQIAHAIGLNPKVDATARDRVKRAIESVPCRPSYRCASINEWGRCLPSSPPVPVIPTMSWDDYFSKTLALNSNSQFLSLVAEKGFSPVKISWEDIGRFSGSVWGDRISDVGIWVRRREGDSESAELALSVRRDQNFRDKVLMVPASQIKIHTKDGSRTRETSLPARLQELGLTSRDHDKNVIVSNQFAVVPVPKAEMMASDPSAPPRTAFNFSIYPYGSSNFVITDVIEGSSNAVVGAGGHQLLFANVNGQKAPFTASRAEDRQDLLKLEATLKSRGMDVDVQRYYLIQIPLKRDTSGLSISSMGAAPRQKMAADSAPSAIYSNDTAFGGAYDELQATAPIKQESEKRIGKKDSRGLSKVAIGHGEVEGPYFEGSGYRGNRAEEPIRVTVVYFVTPVGEVTREDMEHFSNAFAAWDDKAIWGGSFVTPN